LFHPFSQENPLQTGTGLGLAIVNSIMMSKGVDGKVDVSSAENIGTEIKVTFNAEVVREEEDSPLNHLQEPLRNSTEPYLIALCGFDDDHRGIKLFRQTIVHYLVDWWECDIAPPGADGHVAIVNEDLTPVIDALKRKDASRPFIIFTMSRGDDHLMSTVNEYDRIGGFCRVIYKPGGPSRLRSMLKLCLHSIKIGRHLSGGSSEYPIATHFSSTTASPSLNEMAILRMNPPGGVTRRFSEESSVPVSSSGNASPLRRPGLGPRSITAHPVGTWNSLPPHSDNDEEDSDGGGGVKLLNAGEMENGRLARRRSQSGSQSALSPTIAVGSGATLLKSSVGTLEARKGLRVLVVEDNTILRNLL
jgi:hypothetical protein